MGALPPPDAMEQIETLHRHLDEHGIANVKVAPGAANTLPLRLRRETESPDSPIDIIIPTHDTAEDLSALIRSLDELAAHPQALRFHLVANNVPDSARAKLELLARDPRTRLIVADEPFNWSRLSNLGACGGEAPLLLFANDDMRMLTPEWDHELRGLLAEQHVGAVGARLLYPDGTIQHAGILLGWRGGAIHDGLFADPDAPGPNQRWCVTREVAAVTGAFLATRRKAFEQVGGFDELRLPIGYSDVDYCLKLQKAGLSVLWTPHVSLTHYESKSRGLDHLSPAKTAHDAHARRIMRERWGAAMDADPRVHPAFVDATLPFRYVTPTK
jgi:GT2 family glycosyltransferase